MLKNLNDVTEQFKISLFLDLFLFPQWLSLIWSALAECIPRTHRDSTSSLSGKLLTKENKNKSQYVSKSIVFWKKIEFFSAIWMTYWGKKFSFAFFKLNILIAEVKRTGLYSL